MILFQQLPVYSWFSVIKCIFVAKGTAGKPAHVFVTLLVFAMEDYVEIVGVSVAFFSFMAVRNIIFFVMAAVCNIKLFADDWVYSVYVAELFKIECAEHVSVGGKRKGRHV